MTLKELLKLLRKIKKCHPEAADAQVWAYNYTTDAKEFVVNNIGYSKKHKPNRIMIED